MLANLANSLPLKHEDCFILSGIASNPTPIFFGFFNSNNPFLVSVYQLPPFLAIGSNLYGSI